MVKKFMCNLLDLKSKNYFNLLMVISSYTSDSIAELILIKT